MVVGVLLAFFLAVRSRGFGVGLAVLLGLLLSLLLCLLLLLLVPPQLVGVVAGPVVDVDLPGLDQAVPLPAAGKEEKEGHSEAWEKRKGRHEKRINRLRT